MLHCIVEYSSMQQYIAVYRTILLNAAVYSSMPHLSRYHTLHVIVRGMRIWPPNAAKCCKNAGKFFPNVRRLCTTLYTILCIILCIILCTILYIMLYIILYKMLYITLYIKGSVYKGFIYRGSIY